MKINKKKHLLAFLAFLIFYASCQNENNEFEPKDTELQTERTFELKTYNEGLKVVNSFSKVDYEKFKSGETIDKIGLVNSINNQVGEKVLNASAFDYTITQKKADNNDFDTEIIESFANDWENFGIKNAIVNLNNNLNYKKVDENTFEKYNAFTNVLLLSGIDIQNQAKKRNYLAKGGWGCAFAIASFTLSTVAVGTTCVPNPVTIYACPIAAGRAVLAYASMLVACSDVTVVIELEPIDDIKPVKDDGGLLEIKF